MKRTIEHQTCSSVGLYGYLSLCIIKRYDNIRSDAPTSSYNTHSYGFTLMELLVIISILAVLLSLLLPALRSARITASSLICITHMRDMGTSVSLYTTENRDVFPAWLDDTGFRQNPEKWTTYTFQTFSTLASDSWLAYTGLSTDSEVMYCPDNRKYPDSFQVIASPDYVLSESIFAESSYMDPELPESYWRSHLGNKVQTIDATTYPSSKVGLFELFVWHGWKGALCKDCDLGSLEYTNTDIPGSVWFIDGHTDQLHAQDAMKHVDRYPIWPSMTYGATEMGIKGRDQ